jgi:hypothetical protein
MFTTSSLLPLSVLVAGFVGPNDIDGDGDDGERCIMATTIVLLMM